METIEILHVIQKDNVDDKLYKDCSIVQPLNHVLL